MTLSLNSTQNQATIFQQIEAHTSWIGDVAGLAAEKLLRGKKTPFLYVIRAGEKSQKTNVRNYYLTFVDSDLLVRHQPIVVADTEDGLYFENGGACIATSLDDVLHLMIHCEKEQCVPLQQ
jgi:hypothetical protein